MESKSTDLRLRLFGCLLVVGSNKSPGPIKNDLEVDMALASFLLLPPYSFWIKLLGHLAQHFPPVLI